MLLASLLGCSAASVGFSVPIELDASAKPIRFSSFTKPESVEVFDAAMGAGGSGTAPADGGVHNGCGYMKAAPPDPCKCIKVDAKPHVKSCGTHDVGSGEWDGGGNGWCYTSEDCPHKNPKEAWGSIKQYGPVVVCEEVRLSKYACAKALNDESSKRVFCPAVGGGATCPASYPYPSAYYLGRDESYQGCNLKDLVICKKEPPNGANFMMPFLPKNEADWAQYDVQKASFMTSRLATTDLSHYYRVVCWMSLHVRCGPPAADAKRECASHKSVNFLKLEHCPAGNAASCGQKIYKPGDTLPQGIQKFIDGGASLCMSAAATG